MNKNTSVLNNQQILKLIEEKRVTITPFNDQKLKSNWYALHPNLAILDLEVEIREPFNDYVHFDKQKNGCFTIEANDYIVIEVEEKIILDDGVVGMFIPASICIESGLLITTGKLDSNYSGRIKFGIYNVKPRPVNIFKEYPIAYLALFDTSGSMTKKTSTDSKYDLLIREIRNAESEDEALEKLAKFKKDISG
jgi:deoxycytidine triphosphate deaminase